MSAWWSGLALSLQIFYGIGILATIILLVQLVMTLFGADADGGAADGGGFDGSFDGGLDADLGGIDGGGLDAVDGPADLLHDGDVAQHVSGLHILSTRSVLAFLAGFGWTGTIVLQSGRGMAPAVFIALGVGILLMLMVFWLMQWLYSLRQSGSLDYRNAVGQVGTVYVRIPPRGQGAGQIQVLVQGRLATVAAVGRDDDVLTSGSKVKVVGLSGLTTLEVEGIRG